MIGDPIPWILRSTKGVATVEKTVLRKRIVAAPELSCDLFVGCATPADEDKMEAR